MTPKSEPSRPSLAPGQEIAHFRVECLLGQGGMGQVYRARDRKLDRDVALKVLPPELTRDPSRVERFVREARAASALAHPNIVTIYEIGEAEIPAPPAESGGSSTLHFLAMELLEGATLRELIRDDRADLRGLLRHFVQIAEGAARAHEAGIVHRDLKPENVMVTRDGFVKVLDFGLAKLAPGADPDSALSQARTELEITEEGMILGTVGYMSPEQVQGLAADHRTDVFAFGCMLYEAATGRRPFSGDTVVDVMHRILREEPRPIEEIAPEVPAALRRLVRRCLAKDPDRRLQSMRDVALQLSDLVEEYDYLSPSSASGAGSGPRPAMPTAEDRRRERFVAPLIVLALVAATGLVWWIGSRDGSEDAEPSTPGPAASMTLRSLTTSADVARVAISPDGAYLALARWTDTGTGLWITHVATGSSVEVVAPRDDLDFRGVTFTPDGNYLVFVRNDPEQPLYSSAFRVPVLGGTPRKLLFDVDTAPTFSPDGSRMAFVRGAPHENSSYLMTATSEGTEERVLTEGRAPDLIEPSAPAWSPDGATIIAIQEHGASRERLIAVDVEGGAAKPLLSTDQFQGLGSLAWLPDGSGILATASQEAQNTQVWLVSWPAGALRRVSNDLSSYRGVSVTADGKKLVSRITEFTSGLFVAPADRPEDLRQLVGDPRDRIVGVETGADGEIYFGRADGDGAYQIWRTSRDGEPPTQLTHEGTWFSPTVSRDGSVRVGHQDTGDTTRVWRLDPETGQRLDVLLEGSEVWRTAVAPDGSWIVWGDEANELWRRDLPDGEPVRLAERVFDGPILSPDGTRIAYKRFRDREGGGGEATFEIVTTTGEAVASVEAEMRPEEILVGWHPSGAALVLDRWIGGRNNLWALALDGSGWSRITDYDDGIQGILSGADWTPDGEWLVVVKGQLLNDAVLIEGFR